MRFIAFALVALALFASASAATVHIISPVDTMIDSNSAGKQTIELGLVGPGQKIELIAERSSGQEIPNAGEALWDQVAVVQNTLPAGWQTQDSLLYESPLRSFVLVPKDALDGDYFFDVQAYREYPDLGGGARLEPVTFNAHVTVSKDVLGVNVLEHSVRVGIAQPLFITVRVENKGSASDAFQVYATGLPHSWTGQQFNRTLYVPFNSQRDITFEVLSGEQGTFDVAIEGISLSSNVIRSSDSVKVESVASLSAELASAANGMALFPNVEQAIYSLLGLVGRALNA